MHKLTVRKYYCAQPEGEVTVAFFGVFCKCSKLTDFGMRLPFNNRNMFLKFFHWFALNFQSYNDIYIYTCTINLHLAFIIVWKNKSFPLFPVQQKNYTESRSETRLFLHTLSFETKNKPMKKLEKYISLVKRKPCAKHKNATITFAPKPSIIILAEENFPGPQYNDSSITGLYKNPEGQAVCHHTLTSYLLPSPQHPLAKHCHQLLLLYNCCLGLHSPEC